MENGPTKRKSLVKLIRHQLRARFNAVTACSALLSHITGLLQHLDLEIADETLDFLDFRQCEQFDVGVTPRLAHFGCQYTNRAVHRGESLIQLRHSTAN